MADQLFLSVDKQTSNSEGWVNRDEWNGLKLHPTQKKRWFKKLKYKLLARYLPPYGGNIGWVLNLWCVATWFSLVSSQKTIILKKTLFKSKRGSNLCKVHSHINTKWGIVQKTRMSRDEEGTQEGHLCISSGFINICKSVNHSDSQVLSSDLLSLVEGHWVGVRGQWSSEDTI